MDNYDANLVQAVLDRSRGLAPLKRHEIHNTIVLYMAYSGHYGVPEVIELEKARELEVRLRLILTLK